MRKYPLITQKVFQENTSNAELFEELKDCVANYYPWYDNEDGSGDSTLADEDDKESKRKIIALKRLIRKI